MSDLDYQGVDIIPVRITDVGFQEVYSGEYDGTNAICITYTTGSPAKETTIAIHPNQLQAFIFLLAQVSNDLNDQLRPIDENGNLK